MNRKQRRMAQKLGVAVPKDPVYNIKRSDINSMKEQAVSDAADAAMVLLLALPIKVLRDEYGWGTKKRLPEFADKLAEEYQKFADGFVFRRKTLYSGCGRSDPCSIHYLAWI